MPAQFQEIHPVNVIRSGGSWWISRLTFSDEMDEGEVAVASKGVVVVTGWVGGSVLLETGPE